MPSHLYKKSTFIKPCNKAAIHAIKRQMKTIYTIDKESGRREVDFDKLQTDSTNLQRRSKYKRKLSFLLLSLFAAYTLHILNSDFNSPSAYVFGVALPLKPNTACVEPEAKRKPLSFTKT